MTVLTGVVPKFEGKFFFLSNFYEGKFMWRNVYFPTVEHGFQYAKAFCMVEPKVHEIRKYTDSVLDSSTPAKAKHAGRSVTIDVKQWNAMKINVMRSLVHAKFSQVPGLAGQLLNTGAMLLVEGNDWGDTFWGRSKVDNKIVGLNTLGTILMEERGYWLYSNFEDKETRNG